jgi:hypothetical protein
MWVTTAEIPVRAVQGRTAPGTIQTFRDKKGWTAQLEVPGFCTFLVTAPHPTREVAANAVRMFAANPLNWVLR